MVREYMKRVGCTIQPFNNTANAYYYFSFLPDDKKRGLMTDLQKDHKTLDDYFVCILYKQQYNFCIGISNDDVIRTYLKTKEQQMV